MELFIIPEVVHQSLESVDFIACLKYTTIQHDKTVIGIEYKTHGRMSLRLKFLTSLKLSKALSMISWPPLTKHTAASSSSTKAFVLQYQHLRYTDTVAHTNWYIVPGYMNKR